MHNPSPKVSFICPVRNEGSYIERTVRALMTQDYPHDRLEILLVDGMSTDSTRDLALAASRVDGSAASFRILDNPARVTPDAMNVGLAEATGDIIILMGGHAEPAEDYVTRCVETLERTGADCVGGPIRTVGEGDAGRAIASAQSSRFGVGGATFRMTPSGSGGWVDTAAFGAYRKEVFEELGGFDVDLVRNQDDEFNFRLNQSGGRIWLDPSIRSTYYSRSTFGKLWRQYYGYGRFKVKLIKKRGGVPAARHLAPVSLVAGLSVAGIAAIIFKTAKLFLLPSLVYATTTAASAIGTSRRDHVSATLVARSFLTMHFAYGTGFLHGVLESRSHSDG